jgi:hypothetical protein
MKYSKYRILIAYDFSDFSDSVLNTVLEMQKETGFKISVVHVCDKKDFEVRSKELEQRVRLNQRLLNFYY